MASRTTGLSYPGTFSMSQLLLPIAECTCWPLNLISFLTLVIYIEIYIYIFLVDSDEATSSSCYLKKGLFAVLIVDLCLVLIQSAGIFAHLLCATHASTSRCE